MERREAGVELGHGLAPGAAAALDVQDALGACVVRAVGHVAEDCDLRPAVQPADVVGGAALDNDLSAEHAHAAAALARRAFHGNRDLLAPGPDAAADAVLAVGRDDKLPAAVLDSPLDLLFQDARRNARALDAAGDGDAFGGLLRRCCDCGCFVVFHAHRRVPVRWFLRPGTGGLFIISVFSACHCFLLFTAEVAKKN